MRERDLGFAHLTPSLRRWTCQLAAKVERWSVIFTDMESATWWRLGLVAAGATYIRTLPWVRWSQPQLSGDRPSTGCELLVVAYGKGKGRKHWNGSGSLTHFANTCLRGDGKHRCEKPLDLMLDLVEWFSDPGEMVIDPFAGSGTTGLAARLTGREFMGAEMDPEWAAKATSRIETSVLSERDQTRYDKWLASREVFMVDKAKRDANTLKSRLKLEAKKAAAHAGT